MVTMLTPLLGIEMQKKRREVMTMTPSPIPADIALRDNPQDSNASNVPAHTLIFL
jgi:hypothetical protein